MFSEVLRADIDCRRRALHVCSFGLITVGDFRSGVQPDIQY